MIDIDDLHAIVHIEEIKKLKSEKKKSEEKLELYKEVMKNVELFLTFWYEQTTEFGKIKDNFNAQDKFPCEMRIKNDRVKLKISTEKHED